jgi:hypothetical protein
MNESAGKYGPSRSGTATPFRRSAGRSGEAVVMISCDPHPAGRTKSSRYERQTGEGGQECPPSSVDDLAGRFSASLFPTDR